MKEDGEKKITHSKPKQKQRGTHSLGKLYSFFFWTPRWRWVDLVGKCLLRVTIHYCGKFIQLMPWRGESKSERREIFSLRNFPRFSKSSNLRALDSMSLILFYFRNIVVHLTTWIAIIIIRMSRNNQKSLVSFDFFHKESPRQLIALWYKMFITPFN